MQQDTCDAFLACTVGGRLYHLLRPSSVAFMPGVSREGTSAYLPHAHLFSAVTLHVHLHDNSTRDLRYLFILRPVLCVVCTRIAWEQACGVAFWRLAAPEAEQPVAFYI